MTTQDIGEEPRPTDQRGFLSGHARTVSKIAFSPSGDHLASCSADKSIRVSSINSQQCIQTLEGHSKGISDVAWHPRQPYLASAADDLTLGIWDIETGVRLRTMTGHTHFVYCCKFHQDGNVVASGSLDEAIRFWDVRTGQSVKAIPAHSDPVTSLDFIWDGTMLASASSDGLCRLWDFGTGLCLRTLMDKNSPPVSHICFSPNGRFILEGVLNHSLRLWDWRTEAGRVVRRFEGHQNSMFALSAFFVHGTCVASASEDGTIAMWNINSKKMMKHNVDTLPAMPEGAAEETAPKAPEEGSAWGAQSSGPEAAAKQAPIQPKTHVCFDIHAASGLMATSQVGHPEHAIRLAGLPGPVP